MRQHRRRGVQWACAALVTGTLLATSLVTAQPASPGSRFRDRESSAQRRASLDSVGLSEAQKRQLQELMTDSRTEARAIRKRLDAAHRSLREELSKHRLDRARVDRLIGEINRGQLELLRARIRTQVGLRRIVTAEQWPRFRQVWRDSGDRGDREDRGGRRRGTGSTPSRSAQRTREPVQRL